MKPWHSLAAALLACSLHAAAQPPAPTQAAGTVVNTMLAQFKPHCDAARAALATATGDDAAKPTMEKENYCDCLPQALDAAFPAGARATQVTEATFKARLSGPLQICMARTMRSQIVQACDKGIDPFSPTRDSSVPARTTARCTCAKTELGKVADVDMTKASKDSAARYAALVAAAGPGKSVPAPMPPSEFVGDVDKKCSTLE